MVTNFFPYTFLVFFLLLVPYVYAFSIDYSVGNDHVTIVLDDIGSLEVLAKQALDNGNRIRALLTTDSQYKREILVDRILSFSPLINRYLIIENHHISRQTVSFTEAYTIFMQWSFNKEMFVTPKKINVSYTNYYYYFPFSLLYLLPGGPAIYRKNLIIKLS